MKKITLVLALLLAASTAQAAVTVGTAPASLVTSDAILAANTQKALFEFALTADAGETLTSVSITVNSVTATSNDFSSVSVYEDDGDESFDAGDLLSGTNATVSIGSATTVSTTSNNTLTGSKYFVVLKTSPAWSGTDKAVATLGVNDIVTSANSPTTTEVTTAELSAPDTLGPILQSAVAKNKTGGTNSLEAGDMVVLTFGEATAKPSITAANIATTLVLNNSHSWLDGVASIGATSWNSTGTELTISLSAGTSIPTLVVGDTVTIAGSVIKDSAGNDATGSVTLSGNFGIVDSTGPQLSSAIAKNTGGSSNKEAGDSVELTFNEATNKASLSAANINSVLTLNNSHSWLDGAGSFGTASWNTDGTKLVITLSSATSVPSIVVGDKVTIAGEIVKDSAGNNAAGNKNLTGTFGSAGLPHHDDDDDDEDEDDDDKDFGKNCNNGIINGKIYKTEGSEVVYLAASCRLKPFRGAAVFHARGHKFKDIFKLNSIKDIELSDKPALPAGGTLIKGSKMTVWFVTGKGKLRGFSSEMAFKRLGFNFGSVKLISDTDLAQMEADTNIEENSQHPDDAVIKCTSSSTVYMVKGNKRLAFTNPVPYLERGHTWDAVAVVDCKSFNYQTGEEITN